MDKDHPKITFRVSFLKIKDMGVSVYTCVFPTIRLCLIMESHADIPLYMCDPNVTCKVHKTYTC